jgi:hypothetical protein
MEAWGGIALQKYRSMRKDGCTEIWKHEAGWLYRIMEAWGGMAVQNYGSMRRDGCTELCKHEAGWLYRNLEAWGGIEEWRDWKQGDLCTNRGIQSIKVGRLTQREFESVEWLNMNMEGREGML